MEKIKEAYKINFENQTQALVSGNETMFHFYGARLERAERILIKLLGESGAAIAIIDAVIEVA